MSQGVISNLRGLGVGLYLHNKYAFSGVNLAIGISLIILYVAPQLKTEPGAVILPPSPFNSKFLQWRSSLMFCTGIPLYTQKNRCMPLDGVCTVSVFGRCNAAYVSNTAFQLSLLSRSTAISLYFFVLSSCFLPVSSALAEAVLSFNLRQFFISPHRSVVYRCFFVPFQANDQHSCSSSISLCSFPHISNKHQSNP